MTARDLMTRSVVMVAPGDPLSKVARAMLEARVSAVPVVDEDQRPLGVISEWDLIGQHAPDRAAQLDHWLSRLAEGQSLASEYVRIVEPSARSAAEVMTAPAITVAADADLAEIAGVLAVRRVKRVFVVEDGRLVGVVSRADLARALMMRGETTPARRPVEPAPPPPPVETDVATRATAAAANGVSAAGFRHLVEDHEAAKRDALRRQHAARDAARQKLVEKLAGERLSEAEWRMTIDNARGAAERGEKDFLLIRFPSALCDDGGRMINAPDPNWPTSLRGKAADVYERWRDELKPAGFGLVARILEFPDGFPGDAGILLTWGA